mmetsp:Transcript_987/g.1635  ORF Transcript_987/g.1635 Transcript_987/m.1635 type:complete len:85 (-) Transcript_987:185-439(-)
MPTPSVKDQRLEAKWEWTRQCPKTSLAMQLLMMLGQSALNGQNLPPAKQDVIALGATVNLRPETRSENVSFLTCECLFGISMYR